jgi:very-short-patch-repair endonuclease
VGSKRLTPVARKLRRDMTEAEQRLWYFLRDRRFEGEKFVTQFQIGNYVADFACRSARVAVEVDGGQHSADKDAARTDAIEKFGYIVLRFWNNDVLQNSDGVLTAIREQLLLARNRS